jgi:GNAT superfamily N-acetyltransferase
VALTIRRGQSEDAELITRLHASTAEAAYAHIFPDQPFPIEMTMRRWEAFAGDVLVAEEDGRAVGFVAFEGEVLSALYVLPDCWGRGTGGRLLDLAGAVSSLWVLEDNEQGRRFYEHRGWSPDGTAREVFGVRELRFTRAAIPGGSRG